MQRNDSNLGSEPEPLPRVHTPQRQGAIKVARGTRGNSSASNGSSKHVDESPAVEYRERGRQHTAPSMSQSEEFKPAPSQPSHSDPIFANPSNPSTELRAGLVQKSFFMPTELLTSKSPYFAELASGAPTPLVTSSASVVKTSAMKGPFFFPDLDEFAMALFVRWIHGNSLQGPKDFHSMNHYLCLYVLASRFQIEELKNQVMDLVRAYYRTEQMTAPAFRLDYVYANTQNPSLMREFLIRTSAYRVLSEPEKGLSDSVKGAVRGGGDLAIDFVIAVLQEVKSERVDARKGDPCRWHEHNMTPKCKPFNGLEPYENA